MNERSKIKKNIRIITKAIIKERKDNFFFHFQFQIIASSPIYNDPVSPYADRGASNPSSITNEMFLTPLIVSQWEMLAPSVEGDRTDYTGETGDMDVAEDIIFRPLFRYRQETQQRSKYYDESNRRYSYTPYRNYDNYYPRRSFYRPQYNDY